MLSAEELKKLEQKALNSEPIWKIVNELRSLLGSARMIAVLSGKSETQSVDEWAHGSLKPSKTEELRLRYGYFAAKILEGDYGASIVVSAFWSSNSHLGDKVIITWLADHAEEKDLREVVGAALNFNGQGA